MAQHDFVPAWLNFSTPQSAKILGTSPPCSAMILWTLVSLREHMLESQGTHLVGIALPEVMMA